MQKLHHGKASRNFITVQTNGAKFSFNWLKMTHVINNLSQPGQKVTQVFSR